MLTETDTIDLNIALPYMHGWDHAVLGAAHPKRHWDPTKKPIAYHTNCTGHNSASPPARVTSPHEAHERATVKEQFKAFCYSNQQHLTAMQLHPDTCTTLVPDASWATQSTLTHPLNPNLTRYYACAFLASRHTSMQQLRATT